MVSLHLFVANTLLTLLVPLSSTSLFPALSSRIAGAFWGHIQHVFSPLHGAAVTTSGDVLPPGESALVVANHRAFADFYLVQQLARAAHMLPRCRWFAKNSLRWVPGLGWGLWAMGMPFVRRGWERDRVEVARVLRRAGGPGGMCECARTRRRRRRRC